MSQSKVILDSDHGENGKNGRRRPEKTLKIEGIVVVGETVLINSDNVRVLASFISNANSRQKVFWEMESGFGN